MSINSKRFQRVALAAGGPISVICSHCTLTIHQDQKTIYADIAGPWPTYACEECASRSSDTEGVTA